MPGHPIPYNALSKENHQTWSKATMISNVGGPFNTKAFRVIQQTEYVTNNLNGKHIARTDQLLLPTLSLPVHRVMFFLAFLYLSSVRSCYCVFMDYSKPFSLSSTIHYTVGRHYVNGTGVDNS